jgi:ABC-type Fe3+ transport system permease subunit
MPGQMVLLPWARVLGWLGLTNSTSGLVLIHCVQGLSFTTLFFRNYYVNIPDDLIKAARIDGAGFWRIFRKIVLPLSPPIVIVTVIWQFTNIWNEFLFAVIFSSGTHQPITAALIALSAGGTSVHQYNVESAAVLIAALPPLLVYFFGGRSNLDAKLRVEMRTEIKKLYQRLGKTTIYVTHDQVEAMTLASRIAVMHQGRPHACCSPTGSSHPAATVVWCSASGRKT